MMDHDDGDVVGPLHGAQVAKDRRDLAGLVFVHVMQADKRVEDEQARRRATNGFCEAVLIGGQIEPHTGRGDHINGEGGQIETAMAAEASEPGLDEVAGVFRHVEQHPAGIGHGKGVQTRRAAGDGHSHIQTQPAFQTLGQAANRPYAVMRPERLNQPATGWIGLVEIRRAHHGQRLRIAGAHPSTTWPTGDWSMAVSMVWSSMKV